MRMGKKHREKKMKWSETKYFGTSSKRTMKDMKHIDYRSMHTWCSMIWKEVNKKDKSKSIECFFFQLPTAKACKIIDRFKYCIDGNGLFIRGYFGTVD